jgi:hypothetical protein
VTAHIRSYLETDGGLDPSTGVGENCAPLASILPRYNGKQEETDRDIPAVIAEHV